MLYRKKLISSNLITIVVLFLCISVLSLSAAENTEIIVGIVEFEEKTTIGQENAGVIIPEILVTFLKEIGKYQLCERILLEKALEEQELQLSGITDEKNAARIGQIFGLNAIITGSAMKVGDEITISGRMIHTETSEIIASGTVKFKKLKQLEAHLEELAYLLSGYSEKEVKKLLTNREIAKTRLGGRIASGLYINNSADIFSFKPFTGSLFFHSRFIDTDLLITAPFPPAKAGGFTDIVHLNPFIHFGIGAAFTRISAVGGGTISGVKYKEVGWGMELLSA